MKSRLIYLVYVLIAVVVLYYTFLQVNVFKTKIIQDENEYSKELKDRITVATVLMFSAVSGVGILVESKKQNIGDKVKDSISKEIPYKLNPELLSYVYFGYVEKKSIWITFVELIRKGYLKVEKVKVGTRNKKIVTLLSNEEDEKNLEDYEITALELIKSLMKFNDKKEFSVEVSKLKSKLKDSDEYKEKINLYENQIEKEINEKLGETTKEYDPLKKDVILAMIMVILIISIIVLKITSNILLSGLFFVNLILLSGIFTFLLATTKHLKSVSITCWILTCIFFFMVAKILQIINAELLILPYMLMFIILQYSMRMKKVSEKMLITFAKIKNLKKYVLSDKLIKETKQEELDKYLSVGLALGLSDYSIAEFYKLNEETNLTESIKSTGKNYKEFKKETETIFYNV